MINLKQKNLHSKIKYKQKKPSKNEKKELFKMSTYQVRIAFSFSFPCIESYGKLVILVVVALIIQGNNFNSQHSYQSDKTLEIY